MKQITLITAILACLTTTSCQKCENNQKTSKNIVVLVDLSASRDSTVIDWYKQVVTNSILKHVGSKDNLVVLPID